MLRVARNTLVHISTYDIVNLDIEWLNIEYQLKSISAPVQNW